MPPNARWRGGRNTRTRGRSVVLAILLAGSLAGPAGATGRRDDVVLRGSGMDVSGVDYGIKVEDATDVLIADLSVASSSIPSSSSCDEAGRDTEHRCAAGKSSQRHLIPFFHGLLGAALRVAC